MMVMSTVFTTSWERAIGVRVIEDEAAHELIEDWSNVRSPSRAARRRRQGHRQNIKTVVKPLAFAIDGGRTIVAHPALVAELRAKVSAQIDSSIRRQTEAAFTRGELP